MFLGQGNARTFWHEGSHVSTNWQKGKNWILPQTQAQESGNHQKLIVYDWEILADDESSQIRR